MVENYVFFFSGVTKTVFDGYSVNPIEKLLTTASIIRTNKLVGQLNSILQSVTNSINNETNVEPKKKAKNKNGQGADDNKSLDSKSDVKNIEIVENGLSTPNCEVDSTNNNNEDTFDKPDSHGKKKKKKNTETEEKLPNGMETNKKKKNANKKDVDSESSSSRRRKKKNKDILTELDFELEDDGKKRRKRNRNSEMANLLNDLNKCRARRDVSVSVDGPAIEKLMNELNRTVERLEPVRNYLY